MLLAGTIAWMNLGGMESLGSAGHMLSNPDNMILLESQRSTVEQISGSQCSRTGKGVNMARVEDV